MISDKIKLPKAVFADADTAADAFIHSCTLTNKVHGCGAREAKLKLMCRVTTEC